MSARSGLVWLACALGLAVASPLAAAPPGESPEATTRVRVYYAPGACTGGLEVQVFDRGASVWRPHPEHPRLAPGACVLEEPDRLLNELRVRCVDPSGRRAASAWVVGAERASGAAPCPPASAQ